MDNFGVITSPILVLSHHLTGDTVVGAVWNSLVVQKAGTDEWNAL